MFTIEETKVLNSAASIIENQVRVSNVFTNPELVKKFLRLKMVALEYEVFGVMFLDNQHNLIEYKAMFNGSIDSCSVYPREVAKAALTLNAAAVIFAHNHPSGVPEPSMADRRITNRLIDALKLFDISVLDHIVIGLPDVVSFAERGWL